MADDTAFDILNPFQTINIPIADWADGIKAWAISNRENIQPLKDALNWLITNIEQSLQGVPPVIMLVILGLLAWQMAGRRVGILVVACMIALGLLDPRAWGLAMTTLAIVVTSVIMCTIIGVPLGVLVGKSNRFQTIMRPVLDTMQTIPPFVYLVPVVLLIGIGNVSGVVVTIVFALPPIVLLEGEDVLVDKL